MAGFVMRKHQRLKKLVPVRYLGDGIAGEGIIKDLSLTGSYMTGNAPVSIGMTLAVLMCVISRWVAADETAQSLSWPSYGGPPGGGHHTSATLS